jgi:hypothetical protein
MTRLFERPSGEERRDWHARSQAGDTLVEILISLVIMGIVSAAILMGLSTSATSSASYRDLATMDTALRSAANQATSQIQQQPSALWGCPDVSTVTFSMPNNYTAQITGRSFWNGSTFTPTCIPNAPRLYTITVTYNGSSQSISTAIYDPLNRTVIKGTVATRLVFVGTPSNGAAGVPLNPTPVVAVEDASGNIVTSDLSGITLSIAAGTGTSGSVVSGSCTATEFYGVFTFSNCIITTAGTGYRLTATSRSAGVAAGTSGSFDITSGPASQVVFLTTGVSGPASSTANLGPITIQEQDAYGNPAIAGSSGQVVSLSSTSSGAKIFSTSSNGPSIGSITIAAGTSTGTFYYGDTKLGIPTITVASASFSAYQYEAVLGGAPTSLVISNPGTQVAGSAFNVVLTAYDQWGNIATSYSASPAVNLSGPTASPSPSNLAPSYPSSATFVAGSATISGIRLFDATSSVTLTAAVVGSPALSSSTSFSVLGAAPSSITLANCVFPGSTSCLTGTNPIYHLGSGANGTLVANASLLDAYSNAATISSAVVISVSSSSSGNYRVSYSSGSALSIDGSKANQSVNTFTVTKRNSTSNSATITLQVTSGAAGVATMTFLVQA